MVRSRITMYTTRVLRPVSLPSTCLQSRSQVLIARELSMQTGITLQQGFNHHEENPELHSDKDSVFREGHDVIHQEK